MNTHRSLFTTAAIVLAATSCNRGEPRVAADPESSRSSEEEPASAVAPQAEDERLSDTEIAAAIEREFLHDQTVDKFDVDTAVTAGIVELTGTVEHLLAKERAGRIAESVKGVRSVSNRLAVKTPDRPDDEITADIERALLLDPATEAFEIKTTVTDQVATLQGKVQSWAEKQLAERVAKTVKGVEAVRNELEVEYETDRPDTEIQNEVAQRLRWDTLVDDALIDVSVENGRVVLAGSVGSASERRRAAADAWVSGVEDVDDSDLEVQWYLDDEKLRNDKYAAKSPSEIADAIQLATTFDPRVYSFEIQPIVVGSTVTLRGSVDNMLAKKAAEEIARHTVGVSAVKNEIEVDDDEPKSDAEIERDIEWSLVTNPITESFEIQTEVEDGNVTLTGTVDSFSEAAEATSIAMSQCGVHGISSKLKVDTPLHAFVYEPFGYPYFPYVESWSVYIPATTTETDVKIAAEIDDEMFWSPFVDADEVDVIVVSGVATLTGEVDTWAERDAAIENAYEGGALSVVDRLEIEAE